MNVVKTGDGRFIEVQGTAEGPPFERRALDALLALADKGIRQLVEKQRAIVGDIRRACASHRSRSLLIATTNPGKFREIPGILDGVPIELVDARTISSRSPSRRRPGRPSPRTRG